MRRYLAVVLCLGLSGLLIYAAQVPGVLSAFQQIGLMPGDTLTIDCSTGLSGTVTDQEANLTCAPNGTGTQTITFDSLANPDRPLIGQYPNGVIDWGSGAWWLSGPWRQFSANSISFNGKAVTSATFTFVSPRRLIQLDALNGGATNSKISLSCAGQPTVQVNLAPDQLETIATGWTGTCSTVSVTSSNGFETNFDALVIDGGTGAAPTALTSNVARTATPTVTRTPGGTRTPTPTATRTPQATGTPTPTGGCPCSIFRSSSAPTGGGTDIKSVEIGVKFRSDVDGFITGIRFYKLSVNTGPHVASLWSSGGALLARAAFTTESPSGWQQVTFSKPVHIQANTTYVASYHTNGHYSIDQNYFGNGVGAAPLHALADGADGGNGVYTYGQNSAFPTSTFNASNYWVDVVFHP